MLDATDLTGLYGANDTNLINLKGTLESKDHSLLRFNLMKCDPARLASGEVCLSETSDEYKGFFKRNNFGIFAARNFVHFEEVETSKNPVR